MKRWLAVMLVVVMLLPQVVGAAVQGVIAGGGVSGNSTGGGKNIGYGMRISLVKLTKENVGDYFKEQYKDFLTPSKDGVYQRPKEYLYKSGTVYGSLYVLDKRYSNYELVKVSDNLRKVTKVVTASADYKKYFPGLGVNNFFTELLSWGADTGKIKYDKVCSVLNHKFLPYLEKETKNVVGDSFLKGLGVEKRTKDIAQVKKGK